MLIELRNVQKVYTTGDVEVRALQNIDLNVADGEFLAIMGPSGSGKSTLMNLLGLLDRPSAGQFWFAGADLAAENDNGLARLRREQFGFIFQSFNLFPRIDALRNVAQPLVYAGVAPGERARRAHTMLDRVGLGDRAHHRPSQLSGGQQQRVAIARALVNEPAVILADEPTGALDSTTGASILGLIKDLNAQGVTILMVTHDEQVAGHASRIIRLLDGRIVEDRSLAPPRAATVELRDVIALPQRAAADIQMEDHQYEIR